MATHPNDRAPAKRFGEYLVAKGMLTALEVIDVLETQRLGRPSIGKIAMSHQQLTAAQVLAVLNRQADRPHRRFGEIAVELGLLQPEEIVRLLKAQSEKTVPLGQLLVRGHLLSESEMISALAAFERQRPRK